MIRYAIVVLALCAPTTALADGAAGATDFGSLDNEPTLPDAVPPAPRSQTARGDSTSMSDGIADMLGAAQAASAPLAGAGTAISLVQAWMANNQALSALDAELDSRLRSASDGPSIPSSCSSGSASAGCGECFRAAYGEVNFTRMVLERLRTIHRLTINYIKNANALGDTTSGVHGVAGLAWQYAKIDIEKARSSFNASSRAKYEALVNNMRRALHMVDDCERQHFNNADWFDRYGFMYLNFIKDAYEPVD